jgi:hypothetical protein
MDSPALTPDFVRQTLLVLADLDIDLEEAEKLVPWVQATRDALAALDQFDISEVRSSLGFDPTGPYR